MRTDNALDQAQRVIQWFRTHVVDLGHEYSYANDNLGSFAVAKKIAADRDKGSVDIWIVTVDYSPLDDDKDDPGRDVDGNPTDNPLDWRPVISARTNRYSEPVERAKYLGGFQGQTALRIPNGSVIIPMSSAMKPFNPGLEKDQFRIQVVIKRNMLNFDGNAAVADIDQRPLNGAAFYLSWYGFYLEVPLYCAKLGDFDLNYQRVNGYDFLEVTWGFEVKGTPWIDEIVDRDVVARRLPGDPDGRGGTLTSTDVIPGRIKVGNIVDQDDNPMSEPVLLNGDGQPLDLATIPLNPVYLSYMKYGFDNFLTQPFFQGILKAL